MGNLLVTYRPSLNRVVIKLQGDFASLDKEQTKKLAKALLKQVEEMK